ncbi:MULTISPECIES: hypothetical protein [Rhodomicrobium]|uniref:ImuA family protein n=1 Tax=Rhodomicrobium TaxID=1068 RepID=UPI000B4B2D3A|nr:MULTISPECIES: hypothetical protein [Rhodomicrobium]
MTLIPLPSPSPGAESGWADARDAAGLLGTGFHELLAAAPGDETLALGLAFSLAARAVAGNGKRLLYCSAEGELQERGALYGHGLAALGVEPGRVLMIAAPGEKDLLWTLEEAIASGGFGAVLGSLAARERLYNFAASRRLKLRVAAQGVPLYLLRHRTSGGATAAHGRWRVGALPSRSDGQHAGYNLLGPPRLRLGLERMGGLPPRAWEMEFDGARGFHMAALLEDRPARAAGKRRHQAA